MQTTLVDGIVRAANTSIERRVTKGKLRTWCVGAAAGIAVCAGASRVLAPALARAAPIADDHSQADAAPVALPPIVVSLTAAPDVLDTGAPTAATVLPPLDVTAPPTPRTAAPVASAEAETQATRPAKRRTTVAALPPLHAPPIPSHGSPPQAAPPQAGGYASAPLTAYAAPPPVAAYALPSQQAAGYGAPLPPAAAYPYRAYFPFRSRLLYRFAYPRYSYYPN